MSRAFALVLLVVAVGFLVVPQPVVADTSSRMPFRDWIGDMPTAVYRFDKRASHWAPAAGLHEPDFDGCAAVGTFVFRRLDTIQGWMPDTLTVRVRSRNETVRRGTTRGSGPTGQSDCTSRARHWQAGGSSSIRTWRRDLGPLVARDDQRPRGLGRELCGWAR